jgi:hypothetical protein
LLEFFFAHPRYLKVLPTPRQGSRPQLWVRLPLWLPTFLFGIPSAIAWEKWRQRTRPGRCPVCKYDLAGILPHSPCPECGFDRQKS